MFADNIISYIKIPHKYNTYITDHINIFKKLNCFWITRIDAVKPPAFSS